MNSTEYLKNISDNFIMGVPQEVNVGDALKNICDTFSDKFIIFPLVIVGLLITKELVYKFFISKINEERFNYKNYETTIDLICIFLSLFISYYAWVWIK